MDSSRHAVVGPEQMSRDRNSGGADGQDTSRDRTSGKSPESVVATTKCQYNGISRTTEESQSTIPSYLDISERRDDC